MIGAFNVRHALRRRKRALWAAALCSASFATGHYLFGEDETQSPAPAKPSLLSQYLEAKNDLAPGAAENPPSSRARQIKVFNAERMPEERRSDPVPVLRIQPVEAPVKESASPTAQPSAIREALEGRGSVIGKSPPASTNADAPKNLSVNQSSAVPLRSAAVNTANELPFIPAQPLDPSGEVQPAVAEIEPSHKIVVTQASAAMATAKVPLQPPPVVSNPATAAGSSVQKSDEENLPPIVPAWAVPRPGTRKKAQAAPPAVAVEARMQVIQPPALPAPAEPRMRVIQPPAPTPLRIELGESLTPSPAVLPPPAPPSPSKSQPAKTSFQRLPSVEPSLLPPFGSAPQPIALEIRNPHVSQANFVTPVEQPAAAPRQHVDDISGSR